MRHISIILLIVFSLSLQAQNTAENGWEIKNYKLEVNDSTDLNGSIKIGEGGVRFDSITRVNDTVYFYSDGSVVMKGIDDPGSGAGGGATNQAIADTVDNRISGMVNQVAKFNALNSVVSSGLEIAGNDMIFSGSSNNNLWLGANGENGWIRLGDDQVELNNSGGALNLNYTYTDTKSVVINEDSLVYYDGDSQGDPYPFIINSSQVKIRTDISVRDTNIITLIKKHSEGTGGGATNQAIADTVDARISGTVNQVALFNSLHSVIGTSKLKVINGNVYVGLYSDEGEYFIMKDVDLGDSVVYSFGTEKSGLNALCETGWYIYSDTDNGIEFGVDNSMSLTSSTLISLTATGVSSDISLTADRRIYLTANDAALTFISAQINTENQFTLRAKEHIFESHIEDDEILELDSGKIELKKPLVFESGASIKNIIYNEDSTLAFINNDTVTWKKHVSGGSGSGLTKEQIEAADFTALSPDTTKTNIIQGKDDDTVRIEGVGLYNGVEIGTGSGGQIQGSGSSVDTITFSFFSNIYDTINLNRDITLFLDTTGAYNVLNGKGEATATIPIIGKDDFTSTLTITSNADMPIMTNARDTAFRADRYYNKFIAHYLFDGTYRSFGIHRDDTSRLPDIVTTPLYLLSAEIGTQNDSLINALMSLDMTTAVKPQGDWTIANGTGASVVDTVYSNADTLKIQLLAAVSADSTINVSYTKADTTILAVVNDSILQSYSDSSVINNVLEDSIPADYIAFYKFNGDYTDESPNGYDGTNNGTVFTTDSLGNSNSAISLIASESDYVDITPALPGGTYTICGCYTTSVDNVVQGIIGAGSTTTSDKYGIELWYDSLFYRMQDNVGNDNYYISADNFINKWNFVCITRNANDGSVFYVNGSESGSNNESDSFGTYSRFVIGRQDDNTPNFYFDGKIDNIIIYDRILTQIEVSTINTLIWEE